MTYWNVFPEHVQWGWNNIQLFQGMLTWGGAMAGIIRSAAPVTQNHFGKPQDLMLQNATPLRKSPPGPPDSSDEDVSCTALATENASLQILFKCPTPDRFWKCHKTLTFYSLLRRCTIPCACHAKGHLNLQKWRVHVVLCTF